MTKKPTATPEEDEEQSRRFIEEAQKLADAGELNLTEGAEAFERLTSRALKRRPTDGTDPS